MAGVPITRLAMTLNDCAERIGFKPHTYRLLDVVRFWLLAGASGPIPQ